VFITNKYSLWYFELIKRAQGRAIEAYTERHHILPKSMGGSNAPENLVRLTFKEHFIAHWLLTKFTMGDNLRSMRHALFRMCHGHRRQRHKIIAGWQYELARRAKIDAGMSEASRRKLSETQRRNGPSANLIAHLKRLNERMKSVGNPHCRAGGKSHKGRKLSEQTRKNMSLAQTGLKRTPTIKMKNHLVRLAALNSERPTEARQAQLSKIQHMPKTERQKAALEIVHQMPRTERQKAQVKALGKLGLRRGKKHSEKTLQKMRAVQQAITINRKYTKFEGLVKIDGNDFIMAAMGFGA
jgi:hypothetical protein